MAQGFKFEIELSKQELTDVQDLIAFAYHEAKELPEMAYWAELHEKVQKAKIKAMKTHHYQA